MSEYECGRHLFAAVNPSHRPAAGWPMAGLLAAAAFSFTLLLVPPAAAACARARSSLTFAHVDVENWT
jgi:hypothetical protein